MDCGGCRGRASGRRGWTTHYKFIHTADVALCFAGILHHKLLTPEGIFSNSFEKRPDVSMSGVLRPVWEMLI